LYLDIGDYKAAVIAFRNSLRDYPDTKYAEEMEFLIIKAQFLYAKNSLETKQEERYMEVLADYEDFVEKYPQSSYLKEAQDLNKQAKQNMASVKKLLASQRPVNTVDKQEDQENKTSENEQ